MKCFILFVLTFISTQKANSQKIHLSNGIGDVNTNYTFRQVIHALGVPDSVYSYEPKRQVPIPKSLAYNKLFYDSNHFVVRFSYYMLDTLTKRTNDPSIEIFKGSTIALNGDYLSDLDSARIVSKYGKPESVLQSGDELTFHYSVTEKKHFSLLTFYLSNDGTIRKVWINFGKFYVND